MKNPKNAFNRLNVIVAVILSLSFCLFFMASCVTAGDGEDGGDNYAYLDALSPLEYEWVKASIGTGNFRGYENLTEGQALAIAEEALKEGFILSFDAVGAPAVSDGKGNSVYLGKWENNSFSRTVPKFDSGKLLYTAVSDNYFTAAVSDVEKSSLINYFDSLYNAGFSSDVVRSDTFYTAKNILDQTVNAVFSGYILVIEIVIPKTE